MEDLFLILAPHEPNKKNLKNAEHYFKNFKSQRFSNMESPGTSNTPPTITLPGSPQACKSTACIILDILII